MASELGTLFSLLPYGGSDLKARKSISEKILNALHHSTPYVVESIELLLVLCRLKM